MQKLRIALQDCGHMVSTTERLIVGHTANTVRPDYDSCQSVAQRGFASKATVSRDL